MANYKIKKKQSVTHHLTLGQKLVIIIPIVVAVVLLIALVWSLTRPAATSGQANRELLLTTDGHWEEFTDYGIAVWCPNDIEEETLDSETAKTQRLFVTRDKGEFPEIAYGVILVDEDVDNRTFDIENDPSGVLDVTTPVLNEAFGKMINGAYPSIAADIEVLSLASGQPAVVGTGEATVTLVLQDPKDPENPYSEETSLSLYYNVVLFHGRPVIVWSTWDLIVYNGEEIAHNMVTDGAVSVVRIDGEDTVDPIADDWDTVATAPNVVYGDELYGDFNFMWDEEKQQWVDVGTGQVNSELPPPDDDYWNQQDTEQ